MQNIEFEVFTKMSSLSPRLAIPMLHIVIKHLKVSLIVYFLRGLPCFLRWLSSEERAIPINTQYYSIHTIIICSVLSARLMRKNIWCVTLYDSCITGRLSQCYLSIKEKRESLVALHWTAAFYSFNNQFICNEHTEVIFTFDDLFFAGYMNAFV